MSKLTELIWVRTYAVTQWSRQAAQWATHMATVNEDVGKMLCSHLYLDLPLPGDAWRRRHKEAAGPHDLAGIHLITSVFYDDSKQPRTQVVALEPETARSVQHSLDDFMHDYELVQRGDG